MGISWTEEQRKVIETRGRNVLVSAAAGSGKTAVLVERILSLVCGDEKGEKPLDVDRLLVVTFTNAAAAEMRERVGLALEKRLEEDPENVHLQKQQTLIHNAQITTIHSFCQYVIRNYFHQLDLDPSYRIGDEGEMKLLKGDVIKELLEAYYQEGGEAFCRMVESYATGKSDALLEELILRLYEFSMSYPDPKGWLEGLKEACDPKEEKDLEESGFLKFLLSLTEKIGSELQEETKKALALCGEPGGPYMYREALEADLSQLRDLEGCSSYGEYQSLLSEFSFSRLSSKRDPEVEEEKKTQVKAIREGVKKSLKALKDKYFVSSREEAFWLLKASAPATKMLLTLAEEFGQRYREKKREKNLADFPDLEHLALEILLERKEEEDGEVLFRPTAAARELSERYAQVMIDEYQDSSLIQELILNSVSRREAGSPNVFMVGDVKQSIYRFRLARPELFLEKYNSYPQTEEGENLRIDLHKNFRSRREVLEGANYLFSRIMRPGVGGILYDEKAALYLGSDLPEPESDCNRPELILVEKGEETAGKEEEPELSARELEAKAAADRIQELLEGQPIWDKKEEAFRPARYGDVVILLRSLAGWGEVYARILAQEGIPAHTESRTGYFTTIEIQTILNFLRVVDNPRQDIPLAAVLKSMIGGFSDSDLALIKSAFPERPFYEACMNYGREGEKEDLRKRLQAFYEKLSHYRRKGEYLAIHEFLWYVLEDTGYGDYLAAQPGGEQRRANVRMLVEKAIAFEATSYRGLFHFIRYMEQLQSYNEDFGEVSIAGENENAVRIMTIHKSKGLEFPIVIVGGLGKSFNRQDTRSRLVIHPDLGLGVDYVDPEKRLRRPTLTKRVLQKALDLEMLGEELRVLYVALTRAKEKLILLGTTSKLEEKLEKYGREKAKPLSFLALSGAGTYLDWILPGTVGEGSPYLLKRVSPQSQVEESLKRQISLEWKRKELEEEKEKPNRDEAYAKRLAERLCFTYPYQEETKLRVKVSVSELKKEGQAEAEDEGTFLYPKEEIVPYIPKFMQEERSLGGTARGTAYHKVLEAVDFSQLDHWKKVEKALKSLVDAGKLTKEMAGTVRPYDISAFARTDLAKRMTEAEKRGEFYKEQPFVIQVPAAELGLGYESREPVLVQGIIDAFFYEEGEIVVADYKTDYVKSKEELLEKYKKQLDYYELALKRLTGKRVKEKVIYSFCLREWILV